MSTRTSSKSRINLKASQTFNRILGPSLLLFSGIALATSLSFAQQEKQKTPPRPTVVFICEHGAAKSVIAAAWFNRLASERHLPFHAIARGITPQQELSESAILGLQRDGLSIPADKPQPLVPGDISHALRVVAFCPLPSSVKASRVDVFDVPGPNDGYNQSRDAILGHVKALLDDLQKDMQQK